MAQYLISILDCKDELSVVKVVRRICTDSIGDIKRKIRAGEPVLFFDTSDYPIEMLVEDGMSLQHAKIRSACASLKEMGTLFQLSYRVARDDPSEIISPEMMENLFQSQLIDLAQKHD